MFHIIGEFEGQEYYWEDCGNRFADMSAFIHPNNKETDPCWSSMVFWTTSKEWAETCLKRIPSDSMHFITRSNGEKVTGQIPQNLRVIEE